MKYWDCTEKDCQQAEKHALQAGCLQVEGTIFFIVFQSDPGGGGAIDHRQKLSVIIVVENRVIAQGGCRLIFPAVFL